MQTFLQGHTGTKFQDVSSVSRCFKYRFLLQIRAALIFRDFLYLFVGALEPTQLDVSREPAGVDYFNPTFVAPQLTPKQFLIISSPSEKKIAP